MSLLVFVNTTFYTKVRGANSKFSLVLRNRTVMKVRLNKSTKTLHILSGVEVPPELSRNLPTSV